MAPAGPLSAAHRQPLCWNFMYYSRIVLSIGVSVWYMVWYPCFTVIIDSILANSKTQNTFLFPAHAMFHHDCHLAVKPASMPWRRVHKTTLRDSLLIYMLLSAVSVLVVLQLSSEVPEGLMCMNYPVYLKAIYFSIHMSKFRPISYFAFVL
jgi:hypothetical protein